jgi:tetratricopeptide (TPR) repeat protein
VAGSLVEDFPRSLEFQNQLSAVSRDLAMLQGDRELLKSAGEDLVRAITSTKARVVRNPNVLNYRRSLAVHHANLGALLHSDGQPMESESEYRSALHLVEGLVAEKPGLLDYRSMNTLYSSNLALLLRATGRSEVAASAYDGVVAELESLSGEFPEMPDLRTILASACQYRGEVQGILGRSKEADETLDRAIGLAGSLASRWPGIPSYRVRASLALAGLAYVALGRLETDRGRRLLERGIQHLDAALAADPESRSHRFLMLRPTSALAQLQMQEGDSRAALTTARRITELPRNGIEHYNAACFLSLIVQALRRSTVPEFERDAMDRSLSDEAVDHLSKAVALGYRNVKLMATDPDLDPLRSRPDFQLLMIDLTFPRDPFAK